MYKYIVLILSGFFIYGCAARSAESACNDMFQCMHQWDMCYAYCVEKKIDEDGSRVCYRYNRPHEWDNPSCDRLLRISERKVAVRDAIHNCGDYNADRQLSRHNGGILPCDYKEHKDGR